VNVRTGADFARGEEERVRGGVLSKRGENLVNGGQVSVVTIEH